MSGFLLLVTGHTLLMSPKGRNAFRDGLVKIGWVVYSLLFPCIFSDRFRPYWVSSGGYKTLSIITMLKNNIFATGGRKKDATQNNMI